MHDEHCENGARHVAILAGMGIGLWSGAESAQFRGFTFFSGCGIVERIHGLLTMERVKRSVAGLGIHCVKGNVSYMKRKVSILSIVFYALAGLLALYTVWSVVYLIGYLGEQQVVFKDNEYNVVNFYMSNAGIYAIYAIFTFALGFIIQQFSPMVETVGPAVLEETAEYETLDAAEETADDEQAVVTEEMANDSDTQA